MLAFPIRPGTRRDAAEPLLRGARVDQRMARWGTELRRALGAGREMRSGIVGFEYAAVAARRAAMRRSMEAVMLIGSLFVI